MSDQDLPTSGLDESIRTLDDAIEAQEREILLGASLRGDRGALTDVLITRCIRREAGSLHGARVEWFLALLAGHPFDWTSFPIEAVQGLSMDALDAMIFEAARIAYGDLLVSPSRAS